MKRPPMTRKHRASATGFTLLEVLVAILICSFGLLGIVGLQARAVQYSLSAEDTGRAILLANEITTEMYARNTVSLNAAIVTAWQQRIVNDTSFNRLPNARGEVTVTGNVARVTVTWRPTTSRTGSENENSYFTELSL